MNKVFSAFIAFYSFLSSLLMFLLSSEFSDEKKRDGKGEEASEAAVYSRCRVKKSMNIHKKSPTSSFVFFFFLYVVFCPFFPFRDFIFLRSSPKTKKNASTLKGEAVKSRTRFLNFPELLITCLLAWCYAHLVCRLKFCQDYKQWR